MYHGVLLNYRNILRVVSMCYSQKHISKNTINYITPTSWQNRLCGHVFCYFLFTRQTPV